MAALAFRGTLTGPLRRGSGNALDPWQRDSNDVGLVNSFKPGRKPTMPATLETVRPIELAEIREARRAHRGDDRSYAARPPGARAGLPRHPAQAGEPPADQRLQTAGRGQRRGDVAGIRAQTRRLDDQRGKCRTRRRLRGEKSRGAVHGRGDRDRARLKARTNEGARREDSFRFYTMSLGRRWRSARFREWKGPLSIRSTITISSPVMRPWVWRSWKTRPRRSRSSPASAAGD